MLDKNHFESDRDLAKAIALLSTHSRLLVASDFDGTLSSFSDNPEDAALDPLARVALRKLSELPSTFVAVISGRALSDLSEKFRQLERVRLVGSHGHEFDIDKIIPLTGEQRDLLTRAEALVHGAVDRCPGSLSELKPHGVVFHYRGVAPVPTNEIEALRGQLTNLRAGVTYQGNMVLEYSIVSTDKGQALARIQEQVAPTITLFIGDDLTDEAAFKQLGSSEVSVKVGSGESLAKYRIGSPAEAVQLLIQIAERRAKWMAELPMVPIDKHIFISDLRTVALVDERGSVSWLCTPRLDGAPLFGALVGGPGAGHFRISGSGNARQEYAGNTLIGKTVFNDITVTDFLDCTPERAYQRAGRSDFVRLIEGAGEVSVEFAPKFNFGRIPTRLSGIEDGLKVECGQQRLVLLSPDLTWEVSREGLHDVARSRMMLNNKGIPLILLIGTASAKSRSRSIDQILNETQRFWDIWLATLKLPKIYSGMVARSALVLRGLCYGPTGAIAAAATTSLPETIGGSRNWDYRYCWPRDASWAASALLRLNASGIAMRFLDWILGVVFDSEEDRFLAPLYTVTGRSVLGEAEVPEAFGYRNSRPVRIGNLAAEQLQLDALGPIAELMWKLARDGASLTLEHQQLAERFVALVESRWQDTDSGIWEVRGTQRHFVHSKLMCWYTVHCCTQALRYLGVEREDWLKLAERIRAQVETEGFDTALNSYVAAYNLREADAALLWIILSGFHPPDHPRSQGTMRYIMQNLVHDGCVYRYHFDDALHGQEGEFIICRFWLIEALAMMGRQSEAQAFFEELLVRLGPNALMSEEWDNREKCALGNYPQAYSHLGFINAACALDSASR